MDRRIRRSQQAEAVAKAYRGDTKPVCELLRADGWHDVADLIERGRWNKRDAPHEPDRYADVKSGLVARMRWRARRQRFAKGEQIPWLTDLMSKMAEGGDLSGVSVAERDGLLKDVLTTYNRGQKRRRR
jgi:hypothetical protein